MEGDFDEVEIFWGKSVMVTIFLPMNDKRHRLYNTSSLHVHYIAELRLIDIL